MKNGKRGARGREVQGERRGRQRRRWLDRSDLREKELACGTQAERHPGSTNHKSGTKMKRYNMNI